MVYHYAWDVECGRSIMISSALAKLYTAQAGFEVIDDAMQIMGGIGYTNDCKIPVSGVTPESTASWPVRMK